jgi:hypothetical protein
MKVQNLITQLLYSSLVIPKRSCNIGVTPSAMTAPSLPCGYVITAKDRSTSDSG